MRGGLGAVAYVRVAHDDGAEAARERPGDGREPEGRACRPRRSMLMCVCVCVCARARARVRVCAASRRRGRGVNAGF